MYVRSSEGCSLNDLGMFLVNFNILSILTLIILINEIFICLKLYVIPGNAQAELNSVHAKFDV
jgi:hypothetical protein